MTSSIHTVAPLMQGTLRTGLAYNCFGELKSQTPAQKNAEITGQYNTSLESLNEIFSQWIEREGLPRFHLSPELTAAQWTECPFEAMRFYLNERRARIMAATRGTGHAPELARQDALETFLEALISILVNIPSMEETS